MNPKATMFVRFSFCLSTTLKVIPTTKTATPKTHQGRPGNANVRRLAVARPTIHSNFPRMVTVQFSDTVTYVHSCKYEAQAAMRATFLDMVRPAGYSTPAGRVESVIFVPHLSCYLP